MDAKRRELALRAEQCEANDAQGWNLTLNANYLVSLFVVFNMCEGI